MSETGGNRREILRQGVLAAGALAATGLLRPALAAAQSADDEDLRDFLVEAIGLEQVTVLAYSTAAEAAEDAALRRAYEQLRDQEQAHANALRSAIDELGFDPPEAPASAADTAVFDDVEGLADDVAKQLTDDLGRIDEAKSDNDFVELLTSLETDQLTYYAGEGPALDSSDLATTAVEIAGCQAQHLVLLPQLATGGVSGETPGATAASVARTAAEAAPTGV